MMIFISVDFPEPEGPIKATYSRFIDGHRHGFRILFQNHYIASGNILVSMIYICSLLLKGLCDNGTGATRLGGIFQYAYKLGFD